MPKYHDENKLKDLLIANGINVKDAVSRGKFYQEYFDWDYYKEVYESGSSIKKICEMTGMSYDTVRANLQRKGIIFRKFQGIPTYENDISIFKPLNNKGAYMLGWLYSDGHVSEKQPHVSLALSKKDKDHVEYLSELMTNRPICESKVAFTLLVRDKELNSLLRKEYGFTGRKSFTDYKIPLNRFSNEQFPYLLLGLFEGDGCIFQSTSCNILIPSKSVKGIEGRLNKLDIKIDHLTVINKYGLSNLTFTGKNFFRLLHYLYTNTSDITPLARKKQRFLKRVQISMNGKTSPYRYLAKSIWDSLNS